MSHRLDYFPDRNTNTGRELIQAYRNVFSSKQAPTVLWHMLYELGAFEEIPDPTAEDIALKSYASRLLRILGGGEVNKATAELFVKRLIRQPLPNIKGEGE